MERPYPLGFWSDQMQYVSVGFVILCLLAAFLLGFLIPLRFGSDRGGFAGGMLFGSPVTLLGGVMLGYLAAGLGEELVGMEFGVPIGLFIGCFSGLLVLNYFSGGVGMALIALARVRRREDVP